jgi:hypothetical protein
MEKIREASSGVTIVLGAAGGASAGDADSDEDAWDCDAELAADEA